MKDRIDELFDAFTGDGRLGAVSAAVCTSERVIYEGASGTRSPGGDRMTVDSVGFIASMTKAVTGAAAMHCVERGLLDLDQPAGAICPYPSVAFFPPTDFRSMDAWALQPCEQMTFRGRQGFCHDDAASPESRLIGCAIQRCPEKATAANPTT